MKHTRLTDSLYLLRLETGERILQVLEEFCAKEGVKAAFLSGLGACSRIELSHFDLAVRAYSSRTFEGQFEIASLLGNVSTLEDKVIIHAHITVGDRDFRSFCGHLKEAVVSATCEIFLRKLDSAVVRKPDETSGLNLLDL